MVAVDQRRFNIAVIDDLFDMSEIAVLDDLVRTTRFEPQDLGRGAFARRERGEAASEAIADLIWHRLHPVLDPPGFWFDGGPGTPRLDPPVEDWSFVACNPLSRLYRYKPGASFSEHEDEPWRPNSYTRSLLTVLIYLNDSEDCVGGDTVIDGETVSPRHARVAVFDHGLLHEGKPVERGTKIVLRNDVVGSSRSDPADQPDMA